MDIVEKKYLISLFRERRNNERELLIIDMAKELAVKRDNIRNRMHNACKRDYEQKRIANNNYEAIDDSLLYRLGFHKDFHKEASEAYERACRNVNEAEKPFLKEESDAYEELEYKINHCCNKVPQRIRDFDKETFTKIIEFIANGMPQQFL